MTTSAARRVTQRHVRRTVVLVVGGVLTLLSGCSGGDGSASGSAASSEDQIGSRAALSGFVCTADATGSWSATGKLSNAEDGKVTYVVRVSVVGKDSQVKARGTKEATVEPASSSAVSLPKFGIADGKGLTCSAHVTRVLS